MKDLKEQAAVTIKKSICPYDCPSVCGLCVECADGKVLSVKGDPDHPASGGLLCRKMQHYEESINSPERILKPMIRTGKKGEGKFREASWEECISLIADKWKQIIEVNGPEALAYIFGSGSLGVIQRRCAMGLFNYLGGNELIHTLCCAAKGGGIEAVLGENAATLDPRELEMSDLYLVWGCNVTATRFHSINTLTKGRKAGKKVILIDVYGAAVKPYADEVLLIQPGTDGALALAMMHVLTEEKLADEAFLQKWGKGYEEFLPELAQYSPAWAEGITGIPAEKIIELARLYAAAEAPAILMGSGVSRYKNGGTACRLITLLTMFVGAWQKPGGGLCGGDPLSKKYFLQYKVTRPDFRKQKGPYININQMGAAVCDPKLKSLYVYASNLVDTVSDAAAIQRGLMREDFFTVVHERFMTDTTLYADVLLPAVFSVEQSDIYNGGGYAVVSSAFKCIDPPGECKSNWELICLLADAMGIDDPHFRQTEEEFMRKIIYEAGDGFDDLSAEKKAEFLQLAEHSGSIELPHHDQMIWLQEHNGFYVVNPNLEPALQMPSYFSPYGGRESLKLISVPSVWTLNGIFTEQERMMKNRGERFLVMHEKDAAARGIKDGDAVIAENELAKVRFRASLTRDIAEGAVAVVGVFAKGQVVGKYDDQVPNALHHGRLTDLSESTTMNDNTVEVYPAAE